MRQRRPYVSSSVLKLTSGPRLVKKEGPAHQLQHGGGWVVALGLFLRLHPPLTGGLLAHGGGDESHDACAGCVIERHLQVKATVMAQQPGQVQRLFTLHVTIDRAGFVPVDEVGSGLPMALYFAHAEVAAVS